MIHEKSVPIQVYVFKPDKPLWTLRFGKEEARGSCYWALRLDFAKQNLTQGHSPRRRGGPRPKVEDHERGPRGPSRMVTRRRLELPQDCSYTPLKRARLPIPPPGQVTGQTVAILANSAIYLPINTKVLHNTLLYGSSRKSTGSC